MFKGHLVAAIRRMHSDQMHLYLPSALARARVINVKTDACVDPGRAMFPDPKSLILSFIAAGDLNLTRHDSFEVVANAFMLTRPLARSFLPVEASFQRAVTPKNYHC